MLPPPGTLTIQQAAKVLCSRGICTGPCLMFRQLRRRRVLQRDNSPYQHYINCGWFRVECSTYEHPTQGRQPYTRTFVTERGLSAIERLLSAKPVKKSYVMQLNIPDCVLGL